MASFAVSSYYDNSSSDPFVDELSADWFDQYLNYNPAIDQEAGLVNIPETIYLEAPGSESDYETSLSIKNEDATHQSHLHSPKRYVLPARKASTAFSPITAKCSNFYPTSDKDAEANVDLLSFAKLSMDLSDCPQDAEFSPPPSPSPNPATLSQRKNRFVDSISRTLRRATSSLDDHLRSPTRKSKTLTDLMRMPKKSHRDLKVEGQVPAAEASTFEAFDFGFFDQPVPLTPPPSTRPKNALQSQDLLQDFDCLSAGQFSMPPQCGTPLGTPELEHHSFHNPCSYSTPSNRSLHPKTPQFRHVSCSHSPFMTSLGVNDFTLLGSYDDINQTSWWDCPSTIPMTQQSPVPVRLSTHQPSKAATYHLQNNLAYDMNNLDYNPQPMDYTIPNLPSGLTIHAPSLNTRQHFDALDTSLFVPRDFDYPPLPPEPKSYPQSQYTPSPPSRGRQLTKYALAPSRGRNASLSAPKTRSRSNGSEIAASKSHDASSNSTLRKQRKASSSSRSRSRARSAKYVTGATGTGKGMGMAVVDFVNYTPKDGRTILSGVAPSGSSKTKARREIETAERTRRLVVAAGGDVRRLGLMEEDGLC